MDFIGMILTLAVVECFRRQKMLHGFVLGVVNECVWLWVGTTTSLPGLQILSGILLLQYAWGVWTFTRKRVRGEGD